MSHILLMGYTSSLNMESQVFLDQVGIKIFVKSVNISVKKYAMNTQNLAKRRLKKQ